MRPQVMGTRTAILSYRDYINIKNIFIKELTCQIKLQPVLTFSSSIIALERQGLKLMPLSYFFKYKITIYIIFINKNNVKRFQFVK